MLTGDKLETAQNIGESCKLLKSEKEMEIVRLSKLEDVKNLCNEKQIEKNNKRIEAGKMKGLLVEA